MSSAGVIVVGTGQAGAQLAMTLRQKKYAGPIRLIGDEPHLPYERPPLSKGHLTSASSADETLLRPADFWARKNIEIRSGTTVTAIDRDRHRVQLTDQWLDYDHLVLATGAAPRQLPMAGNDLAGVHLLRTRDQADALRSELPAARDVVVVGAGFIGLEVAAAARHYGATVTVAEVGDRAMSRVVSHSTSADFLDEHRARGVQIKLHTPVTAIVGDDRVRAVRIGDGYQVPCDVLITGIGVQPRTELADMAGLACADGIIVDDLLRTSDPLISAIGDCASYPGGDGSRLRLESVQNAADQARCVADRLTGSAHTYRAVPWFWTHQYDLKLQVAGISNGHDHTVVRGSPSAYSVYCFAGSRLLAVESVNRPTDHLQARKLLAAANTITPEVVANPGSDLADHLPTSSATFAERKSS